MSGLLGGWLSPALTALTQTVGGYEQGKVLMDKQQRQEALLARQAERTQKNDEVMNVLRAAQTGEAEARARAVLSAKPKRTAEKFMTGGKAVQGSVDESGTYYDAAGNPVTEAAPFAAPSAPIPGTPEWKAMEIERAKIAAQYGYHAPPQASYTPVTLGGENGQPPVIKPFNTRTGEVGPVVGTAKPAVTRVESAMNVASNARLTAAVSEMNNAHDNMDQYEAELASGQANINGLQQFLAATGSSFSHDDPASRLVQTQALALLNSSNPELARYIRRGLSFAEGESMVSNRPSDFRTKMSQFLSTAASGASPDMIQDIQSRRKALLDPLNAAVSNRGSTTGTPVAHVPAAAAGSRAAKPPSQLWDEAVAKYGEATVLQQFGPRPPE